MTSISATFFKILVALLMREDCTISELPGGVTTFWNNFDFKHTMTNPHNQDTLVRRIREPIRENVSAAHLRYFSRIKDKWVKR